MYNQQFFIPRYYGSINPMMMRSAMGRNIVMRGGLFSRIAASISNFKNFNWGGLINNTSKTLGIINQTIPLVRQVKPVVSNMRSMIKIASIFKDETDSSNISNKKSIVNDNTNYTNNTNINNYDDSPTFFI